MHHKSSVVLVLVLWVAGLCAAAQFAKFAIALPEIAQIYPQSGALLGLTLSLISLVGALFGLSAGAMANWVSLHKLLLFGLLTGAGISLAQAYGLPLYLLMISRVLEGASHLTIVITAPALISMVSSERFRSSAMTLWGTFFGVSFALTAVLGLPLVHSYGVHALFLAHGLLTALVAAIVLVAFAPATGKFTRQPRTDTARTSASQATLTEQYKRAVLSPSISAPAAGWLFYTLTFVALVAILPDLAAPELRSFTATILPIASIVSSMTIGVALLLWWSAVRVICMGFVLAMMNALLLIVMPESVLVSALLFASLGLVQGASFAAIPQLNPSSADQTLAYGALAQTGNIGNLLGTPVMLSVLSASNFTTMTGLIMACYLVALGVHILLAKRRNVRR